MVNKKPLIIAAIMGIVAVALVFGYIKKVEQNSASKEIEYGKVVVAKEQIPVRTNIKESMLEEIIVPVEGIHKDAVTEIDEALGKVSNQVVFEGEQLLYAKFEDSENLRELAFIIEEGQRGVSVGISDIKGLGGNLKPGDHVDVVGVFPADITGVDSSFTILSDVMVKAVGQSIGPETEGEEPTKTGSSTVTLSVTPQQAEKLVLADEKGVLRLTLRRPEENYTPTSDGTSIYDIVKWYPPIDTKPAAPAEASAPLPKYPEYFNNTPPPDNPTEVVNLDVNNLAPQVERIKIELIKGGEVEEIYLEKPKEE